MHISNLGDFLVRSIEKPLAICRLTARPPQRYKNSDRGTIMVFAALALVLLLLIIGMALEFSRIQNVKAITVSAAQVAIVSAAKLYPEKCGADFFKPLITGGCLCPTGSPADMPIPVHSSFIDTYLYVYNQNTAHFGIPVAVAGDIAFRATCSDFGLNKVYDFYASSTTTIDTIFLGLFGYSTHTIGHKVHANRRD